MSPSEDLRRRAIESLAESADPRVRESLRVGELAIVPGVASWEGSGGKHDGHRVVVSLPANLLGSVTARPSLREELEAALAKAVSGTPHASMADLCLAWSRTVDGVTSIYRGPLTPSGESFGRAVFDFLWGAGEESLAEQLGAESTMTLDDAGTAHVTVQCSLSADARARLSRMLPILLADDPLAWGAAKQRPFAIRTRTGADEEM